MSETDLAPIVVEQPVACAPEHAFRVWTERFDAWWPREKSFAGADAVTEVVLEGRVGGSIHEVRRDGTTQPWGSVTAYDPPRSLAFRWHLMFPAQDATDVEVSFLDDGAGGTLVRVVHGAWERLPADVATERRARNRAGWGGLLPVFAEAATRDGTVS